LRLLQQARDEAHRFAITFNRTRRKARTVTSRLLELPGIGPKKRRALLTAFGSLEGVRGASPEAIAAIPGFSVTSATRLLDALRETTSSTTAPGVPPAPDDILTSEP
jgi:excinuclease ABC subunit C